jgi:hypothetical protein
MHPFFVSLPVLYAGFGLFDHSFQLREDPVTFFCRSSMIRISLAIMASGSLAVAQDNSDPSDAVAKAHEEWIKAHPPVPQDTVVNFFPIRSSVLERTGKDAE